MPPVGTWLIVLLLMPVADAQSSGETPVEKGARLGAGRQQRRGARFMQRAAEEAPPRSSARGEALLALSHLEARLGTYPIARAHAVEAAGIFSALGDSASLARACNNEGLASLYEDATTWPKPRCDPRSRSRRASAHRSGERSSSATWRTSTSSSADTRMRRALCDEAIAVTDASISSPWAPPAPADSPRQSGEPAPDAAPRPAGAGDLSGARRILEPPGCRANRDSCWGTSARCIDGWAIPIRRSRPHDEALPLFARDPNADAPARRPEEPRHRARARSGPPRRGGAELHDGPVPRHRRRQPAGDAPRPALPRARRCCAKAIGRARATTSPPRLALAGELRTPEEEWKALYGMARTHAGEPAAVEYLTRAVRTIEQVHENIRVPSLRSDFFNDKREVYDALIAATIAEAPVADVFSLLERSHSRGWRERLGLLGNARPRIGAARAAGGCSSSTTGTRRSARRSSP